MTGLMMFMLVCNVTCLIILLLPVIASRGFWNE